MENATNRLLKLMKNSGRNTVSELVGLTVQQVNPLQLTDTDKLILTKDFIIFNSMINTDRLTTGDKLLAITLNDGQMYYITDVVSSALELNKYKLLIEDLETEVSNLRTSINSLDNRVSALERRI